MAMQHNGKGNHLPMPLIGVDWLEFHRIHQNFPAYEVCIFTVTSLLARLELHTVTLALVWGWRRHMARTMTILYSVPTAQRP